MPDEISLTIQESYSFDQKGSQLARFDPDTMLRLKISPREAIQLEAEQQSGVVVGRLDKEDWNKGIMRVEETVRKIIGAKPGDEVTVRRVNKEDVETAEEITLVPMPSVTLSFSIRAAKSIKRTLANTLVASENYRIPLIPSEDQHTFPLWVDDVRPDAPVRISGETNIILKGDLEININETIDTESDYDVFICHASEDKEEIVRPLANALSDAGLRVWYDEFELEMGDSLRQKIDYGLSNSRYGVVILSPSFWQKEWTQHELDGLLQRDLSEEKVLLTIRYDLSISQLENESPSLANRYSPEITHDNIDEIVEDVLDITHKSLPPALADLVSESHEVSHHHNEEN